MVRVIAGRDPTCASLHDCVEALRRYGFDPADDDSLAHGAHWLSRLGNDRSFVGDLLVELLGSRDAPAADGWMHLSGHQLALADPAEGGFRLLATIWPDAHGGQGHLPGYGRAHDHVADLIALGYFGPGTLREHFEHQDALAGQDAASRLRPAGQMTLGEGCMVHYRARRDVQRVHPPVSLSISLSLVHRPVSGGRGQRRYFHGESGHLELPGGGYPGQALLRAAVALGGERAEALALNVATHHASDDLRLVAWEALAAIQPSSQACDALWRMAERSGNRRVAAMARHRRAAL